MCLIKNSLLFILFPLSVLAGNHTPYIIWQVELIEIKQKEKSEIQYDTLKIQKVGIFLNDSSFYVTKGLQRTVYDLKKEKIYFLDLKSKTYDETSLYAEIDYRRTEFLNRLKLKEFLATKGIENKVGSLNDLESLFGIVTHPESINVKLEEKNDKGFYNYKIQSNSLASFKFSDESLNDKKNIFEKYLLYETQIHPNIIKTALEKNLIPEKISFTFFNSGKRYLVNYTLTEVDRKISPADFGHNYYLFNFKAKTELLTAINKVYGYVHNNQVKLESYEECLDKFDLALKKKNYIDAFLILIENNLSTEKSFDKQFDILKQKAGKDKQYQKFIEALYQPESKEETKAKIEVLEKLSKKRRIERAYLIDAFIASYYTGLGNQTKAYELFNNIIQNNPYITSIYADLGDLFAEQYNMRVAWKCYETAIKLNPNHSIAKKLLIKQAFLKRYYPDFFM